MQILESSTSFMLDSTRKLGDEVLRLHDLGYVFP